MKKALAAIFLGSAVAYVLPHYEWALWDSRFAFINLEGFPVLRNSAVLTTFTIFAASAGGELLGERERAQLYAFAVVPLLWAMLPSIPEFSELSFWTPFLLIIVHGFGLTPLRSHLLKLRAEWEEEQRRPRAWMPPGW
jgi:hypothetical protein